MMHYRDMTFCGFYRMCSDGEECPRALTLAVEDAAHDKRLPISRYMDPPECYEDITEPGPQTVTTTKEPK